MKLGSSLASAVDDAAAVLRARYYLRAAQALGPRVRVWGAPFVTNNGKLLIGDRVRLSSIISTLELSVGRGGTLQIGDRVLINHGSSLGATKLVRIGERCNIGPQSILIDNSFHELDPERRNESPESAPVILEDNVWLAARVIVLPGVTIGTNSVIGAGSVVTKDIPANVLAAGIPAKVIRPLR
ncbi:MAG: transferase hexapeptide repeat containing protein [Polyangiaceae bacterium]|jgi:maltose O-acetyltransferase|nr:transferase hexapeptide repeat containing protein [Polyangiaceae bacterium]